jgi:hypothetical protein
MAHGIEPIPTFDITLATFLVPDLCPPITTAELITARACQLQNRLDDLAAIHERVLKSRFASARQFERQYENIIVDHNFRPGDFVLVRNAGADSELGRKTKPRYCGPMVVIRRSHNGAYRLAEIDGAISRLRYAAFRLILYFSPSRSSIPVTRLLDREELAAVIQEASRDDSARTDRFNVCLSTFWVVRSAFQGRKSKKRSHTLHGPSCLWTRKFINKRTEFLRRHFVCLPWNRVEQVAQSFQSPRFLDTQF